jgi:hypothetical protein
MNVAELAEKFFGVADASVSEMVDYGTVAEMIGAKGSLGISPKSLRKGNLKLINVALQNEEGTIRRINCSGALTLMIREALAEGTSVDEVKAGLLKLNIGEWDESGIAYIVLPAGAGTIFTTAKALLKLKKIDFADIATQAQLA